MDSFLSVHRPEIKGVLSGWDRLRLRGTLRLIANVRGMGAYLSFRYILLKHFTEWAKGLTSQVLGATKRIAETAGRPIAAASCAKRTAPEKSPSGIESPRD